MVNCRNVDVCLGMADLIAVNRQKALKEEHHMDCTQKPRTPRGQKLLTVKFGHDV